jgi:hypothetical protein
VRWGFSSVNSHYGLLQNNVFYNWGGAGAFFDDRSSWSLVDGNLSCGIWSADGPTYPARASERTGGDVWDFGFEGVGFWFRGFNNRFRNNVSYDCEMYGWTFAAYQSYKAMTPVPQNPGDDPSLYVPIDMHKTPLLEHANNEVWSSQMGTIWHLGCQNNDMNPTTPESVVKNAISCHGTGDHQPYTFYGYFGCNLTFDNLVALADASVLSNPGESPTAFFFGDYPQENFKIINSEVQGYRVGAGESPFIIGTFTVSNTLLRNCVNVSVPFQSSPGDQPNSAAMPPKATVLDTVKFDALPGNVGGVTQWNISLQPVAGMTYGNLIALNTIAVTNYNGVAGDNFSVYFAEQDPAFVLPQSTPPNSIGSVALVGAPAAGLTNAQAWGQYGIAIAGAVMPAGTITRAGIQGKVL